MGGGRLSEATLENRDLSTTLRPQQQPSLTLTLVKQPGRINREIFWCDGDHL
jgi:hypothetical protein